MIEPPDEKKNGEIMDGMTNGDIMELKPQPRL